MNIRLGVICPKNDDATSYYRGWGPLLRLARSWDNGIGMELVDLSKDCISWRTLLDVDAVFFQRPFGVNALKIQNACLSAGKPTWCDWDDLIFAVPRSNPVYGQYASPQDISATRQMASQANVVTVSTGFLKRVLLETNANVEVLANAVDSDWYQRIALPAVPAERRPMVWWRGSGSQLENLRAYAGGIEALAKKRPEIFWVYQGADPWFMSLSPKNSRHVPWSGIPECFLNLMCHRPTVVMVPMVDMPFNRARSNTAWLEGTMAGAAVLVPDWEEWRHPGVTRYDPQHPSNFADFISDMLDSRGLADAVSQSTAEILSRFQLKQVNQKRRQIIEELVGKADGCQIKLKTVAVQETEKA